MSEKKGLDNLDVKAREEEINIIKHLYEQFGESAFRAIQKYHFSSGYQRGYELLNQLIREKKFSSDKFWKNPTHEVRDFLISYFERRGGNMPEIWAEGDTAFLKTRVEVFCVTEEAEKQALKCHSDVCNIYCRSFIEGFVKVLQEIFPGVIINFYNLSSRRDGKKSDCVEAFQVKHFKNVK